MSVCVSVCLSVLPLGRFSPFLSLFSLLYFYLRLIFLPAETKKMVGELLRLGVPTEGVNVVVRRILEGLNGFKVEGWPKPEDIDKINNEDREETF